MHHFSVWAPNASKVTLQIDGDKVPMERAHRGNWTAHVESAQHGSDYGFLLDGDEKVFPDPRSVWQPDGVHGLSRVFDASRFQWSDNGWNAKPLAEAVMYELHVGSFTPEGTFDSIIEKLPYLRELGVTHVELMPIPSFDGERGWGYDGVQIYAAHRAYGGPEALQRLVNACHQQGLAILLDVVYNHFGPAGNYAPKFGPYLTDKHVTPWSEAINLEEAGSFEVRCYLVDNALHWMRDFHFDGLRLDAVQALVDRSAKHFLEELSGAVAELSRETGRRLVLIAESDLNDPKLITPVAQGGMGLDAQWIDDFHHALWAVLTGDQHGYYADFGKLEDLAKTLVCAYVYDGQYSEFRHRQHGRPITAATSGHNFVAYIHNHDQVGNRTKAERLSDVVSLGKAKIGAAVVVLSPFTPLLFQGEEFASSNPLQYFTDFGDPALAKAVTDGRKAEHSLPGMSWDEVPDPQDPASLEKSKLAWEEVERGRHGEMLQWHRELIALRRQRDELRDGDLSAVRVWYDEQAKWLAMQRGAITLLCNFSSQACAIELQGDHRIMLASQPGGSNADGWVQVPAETALVLTMQ